MLRSATPDIGRLGAYTRRIPDDGMVGVMLVNYPAGGSLLPLGGAERAHKGYGLIVLVELVVGLPDARRHVWPERPILIQRLRAGQH